MCIRRQLILGAYFKDCRAYRTHRAAAHGAHGVKIGTHRPVIDTRRKETVDVHRTRHTQSR